jgi:hypothetical protein
VANDETTVYTRGVRRSWLQVKVPGLELTLTIDSCGCVWVASQVVKRVENEQSRDRGRAGSESSRRSDQQMLSRIVDGRVGQRT